MPRSLTYILVYQCSFFNGRNAEFPCLFLYTLDKRTKKPLFLRQIRLYPIFCRVFLVQDCHIFIKHFWAALHTTEMAVVSFAPYKSSPLPGFSRRLICLFITLYNRSDNGCTKALCTHRSAGTKGFACYRLSSRTILQMRSTSSSARSEYSGRVSTRFATCRATGVSSTSYLLWKHSKVFVSG